jgi:hypothetical protein
MTPRRTWPHPTWRGVSRLLALVIVTALSGTLIGPVIGGSFGYTWSYVGGIAGPAAMLAFGLWTAGWILRFKALP